MILEVTHLHRKERHAICITDRGILYSFRQACHKFRCQGVRVDQVILTPDEEHMILQELPPQDDLSFLERPGRLMRRTLYGVPIEVRESLTLAKIREARERLIAAAYGEVETSWQRALMDCMVFGTGLHIVPYGQLESQPQRCRHCGHSADHFFTSQRDQTHLCATCFAGREAKGLAKEVTKSKHPLDAWMEG